MLFLKRRTEPKTASQPAAALAGAATLPAALNWFYLEPALEEPDALQADWNYTDRADRLNQTAHRVMARGYFEEAALVFERATHYDRAHYGAYVGQTEALVLLGRNDEAERVVDAALHRYGRNCALGAACGHVLLHQGEYAEALEHSDIATEYDALNAYAWLIAGEVRLATPEAFSMAQNCFDRAREALEPWPNLDLRIALAMLEWHHPASGLDLLLQVLARDPDCPLAWILSGDGHRILGQTRQARVCYRRAEELVPELPSVQNALSWRARVADAWRGAKMSLAKFVNRP